MISTRLYSRRHSGIAFVGNYFPRRCGIATFTHDLATSVARQAGEDQPVLVTAMNDTKAGYNYPDIVKFEIRQDFPLDYSRAADFLNFSHIDIVHLQHEYGIYGGEYGSDILRLLNDLNRPTVVTCHTVLEKPPSPQKEIMQEIAACAQRLVVMSERAIDFLESGYNIPRDKVHCIPHGIHDTPFIDPNFYKDQFGVEGQRVLLTFGLLRRDKGIEYMIEALPRVIDKHPNTTYIILGATHPALIESEGESYRLSLQRRVRSLGLENNVVFFPHFVELDELLRYLGTTDIFVTPYLHIEQITSGALAYAMGSGKAVISTPYWHAEELLADDRGILVPVRDANALSDAVNSLLDDEVRLTTIRKNAYNYCRSMTWSEVARRHLELFDDVRSHLPTRFPSASAMRSPIATTNSPSPKIDHLVRLCDDTGPCHHARFCIPDWQWGYTLQDATTVLVAATNFYNTYKSDRALQLAETSLSFLQTLIGRQKEGVIPGEMNYQRQIGGPASQATLGKTIWALGYAAWRAPEYISGSANELFHQILSTGSLTCPRAAAYGILGTCNYLHHFPGATAVRRFLTAHIDTLQQHLAQASWHEKWPDPDWPIAAQAICLAAEQLESDALRTLTEQLMDFLCSVTENGTVFGIYNHDGPVEQSPVTAATFIEALAAAQAISSNPQRLNTIRSGVDWFLGVNQRNEPLYDFATGGCRDSLTASGVNENQGTEATAYCLLAFLSLNQIISMQNKKPTSGETTPGETSQ